MSKRKQGERRTHRTANPAYTEGMMQIRRSNAAGPHAFKYTRRLKTRQTQLQRAMKEYA